MYLRIVRWAIYGVVLSIVPVVARWVIQSEPGEDLLLTTLLRDEDLLLVGATISAHAIGAVNKRTDTMPARKELFRGGCVVSLALSALLFGAATHGEVNGSDIASAYDASTIVALFAFSLVTSFGCIVLSGDTIDA